MVLWIATHGENPRCSQTETATGQAAQWKLNNHLSFHVGLRSSKKRLPRTMALLWRRWAVAHLVLERASTGTITDVDLSACPPLTLSPTVLAKEVNPVSHGWDYVTPSLCVGLRWILNQILSLGNLELCYWEKKKFESWLWTLTKFRINNYQAPTMYQELRIPQWTREESLSWGHWLRDKTERLRSARARVSFRARQS